MQPDGKISVGFFPVQTNKEARHVKARQLMGSLSVTLKWLAMKSLSDYWQPVLKGEKSMHRVVYVALSMVFGSFSVVLVKSTVISFTNLIVDSFNFWFAKEKVTSADTRHEIIEEFLRRISWLTFLPRKIFH